MATGQALKNLPIDVVMNIQSYLMGEPITLKMRRNEALKAIQNKYKINYTEPRIWINAEGGYRGICYEMKAHKLKSHRLDNETNRNSIINYIKDNEVIKTNDHQIELRLSTYWQMKTLGRSGEIGVERFYQEEFSFRECPSPNLLSRTFNEFKTGLERYERNNFNDQRHFTDVKLTQFQIQVIMKD